MADITAGKFFQIGTLEVSVGVIPFPLAFLITDLVNEYYGRKGAQFLTSLGCAMLVLAFSIIWLTRGLPTAVHSPVSDQAFNEVFGVSFRFFLASLVAFLVSQIADIYTFQWYKRITQSRHLWLRATGSTMVSQVVDTALVNVAALYGVMSLESIFRIAAWSYFYKVLVAILLTPLCYAAHAYITKRWGIEPEPYGSVGTLPAVGP